MSHIIRRGQVNVVSSTLTRHSSVDSVPPQQDIPVLPPHPAVTGHSSVAHTSPQQDIPGSSLLRLNWIFQRSPAPSQQNSSVLPLSYLNRTFQRWPYPTEIRHSNVTHVTLQQDTPVFYWPHLNKTRHSALDLLRLNRNFQCCPCSTLTSTFQRCQCPFVIRCHCPASTDIPV